MKERSVQIPVLQGATYNRKFAPGWTSFKVFKCAQCKRIRQSDSPHTTGYGYRADKPKRKICFDCTGKNDRERLIVENEIVLYLVQKNGHYFAQNWPGSLSIPLAGVKVSDHNFAGRNGRTDVWFAVGNNYWHGVNIGDNQILRCKRVKSL